MVGTDIHNQTINRRVCIHLPCMIMNIRFITCFNVHAKSCLFDHCEVLGAAGIGSCGYIGWGQYTDTK